MEVKSNIFGMLCCITSRKVKTQLKCKKKKEKKKKISAVYGEINVTEQTSQKWFVKFWAGGFSLGNAPWLGKPVDVDRDQIETLRTNNIIPHGR